MLLQDTRKGVRFPDSVLLRDAIDAVADTIVERGGLTKRSSRLIMNCKVQLWAFHPCIYVLAAILIVHLVKVCLSW